MVVVVGLFWRPYFEQKISKSIIPLGEKVGLYRCWSGEEKKERGRNEIRGTRGDRLSRERETDICRAEICLAAIENPSLSARRVCEKYTRKRPLIGFAQE